MPSNTCLTLIPTAIKAMRALSEASGCSMTRVVEFLLVKAYDEHMANPDAPIAFPRHTT